MEKLLILFPGTSVESIDKSTFDEGKTLTVNKLISKFQTDYYLLIDPLKLSKVFFWFNHRPETQAFFSKSVLELLDDNPPLDFRHGVNADESSKKMKSVKEFETTSKNIVIESFRLAMKLGFKEVDAYGLDYYARPWATHAFNTSFGRSDNAIYVSKEKIVFDHFIEKMNQVETFLSKEKGFKVNIMSDESMLKEKRNYVR